MLPLPPTGEDFNSSSWQNWFFSIYQALRPTATRQASSLTSNTVAAAQSIQAPNFYRPVKRVSADYVMSPNDCVLFVDCTAGDVNVTLPLASGGRAGYTSRRTIRRVDGTGNLINMQVQGTDVLDTGGPVTISGNSGRDFDCDGSTQWYTVGSI